MLNSFRHSFILRVDEWLFDDICDHRDLLLADIRETEGIVIYDPDREQIQEMQNDNFKIEPIDLGETDHVTKISQLEAAFAKQCKLTTLGHHNTFHLAQSIRVLCCIKQKNCFKISPSKMLYDREHWCTENTFQINMWLSPSYSIQNLLRNDLLNSNLGL